MGGGAQFIGKGIQSFGVTMGALARGKGERSAERARQQGSEQSDEQLRQAQIEASDMYNPIREPGMTAFNQAYQRAMNPRDPAQFLQNYYQGPEFNVLRQQSEQDLLRNQAATGGFRSGATQVGLGQIAPMLGLQAFQRQNAMDQQQFENLMGVARPGLVATEQQANLRSGLGTNLAQGAMFRGMNKGQSKLNQYANIGQANEDLGAIWGDQSLYETKKPQGGGF